MKKSFYTGLVIVLPIVISFYILNWALKIVIRLITGTQITRMIRRLLKFVYSGNNYELEFQVLTYITSLILILLFITLLGYTMKIMFFSKIMNKISEFMEKIPVVKSIYTTSKQIIEIVYSSEKEDAYRKVVLIEYPRKGLYAIGFMTAERNESIAKAVGEKEIANVFIPTSPNPTSGMLVCVPTEDVKVLNISMERAFKLIISGGYITEETIKRIEANEENKDSDE